MYYALQRVAAVKTYEEQTPCNTKINDNYDDLLSDYY
jgi:hypothetical protein